MLVQTGNSEAGMPHCLMSFCWRGCMASRRETHSGVLCTALQSWLMRPQWLGSCMLSFCASMSQMLISGVEEGYMPDRKLPALSMVRGTSVERTKKNLSEKLPGRNDAYCCRICC